MKVLALCNEDPRLLNSGGKRRDYEILQRLRAFGDLSVMCFKPHFTTGERSHLGGNILVRNATRSRKVAGLRSAVGSRLFFEYLYDFTKSFRDQILQERPHFVYLSMPYAAAILNDRAILNHLSESTVIWDTQNFDPDVWQLRLLQSRGLKRWINARQSSVLPNRLAIPLERCDIVVACTDADANKWSDYGARGKIVCCPNGVDVSPFEKLLSSGGKPGHFATIGSLDNFSTETALLWFLDSVWPAVFTGMGGKAHLKIIGRNPSKRLIARAEESLGVGLVANPPTITDHLDDASCVVLPQTAGTGSKLKVLDSLATGRSVVCSPASVIGLHHSLLCEVEVVSSVKDWVTAMIRQRVPLKSEVLRRHRLCADVASWDKSAADLLSTVDAVLRQRPLRPPCE